MTYRLEDFLGNSSEVLWIRRHLVHLAQSQIPVLIYGETGTGKTMLAGIIHDLSPRREQPYVHLDCGSMLEDLVANELFGHMRGSYTSADRTQQGLIEQANKGTLFLDELGNLSFEAQTKLLQVLDEGRFRRVGGVEEIQVDVRIVGASSLPLRHYVEKEKIRKDLYYRLKGIRIALPPLRQRRDDILLIFNHYLSVYCHRLNRKVPRVTREAREIIVNYPWPGNVRELKRLAEEIASLHQLEHVTPADLQYLDLDAVRCWEYKHCDLEVCPAHSAHEYRCWLIDNTRCIDGLPRTVSQKMHYCLDCEIFLRNCLLQRSSKSSDRVEFLREQINLWAKDAENQPHQDQIISTVDHLSFKEFRERVMHISIREYFAALMRKHHGNLDRVCKQSGLSKSTIYQMFRKHGLSVEEFNHHEEHKFQHAVMDFAGGEDDELSS